MKAEFMGTIDMAQSTNEAMGYMYPTGAPEPGGDSYQDFLAIQKIKQNFKNFPVTSHASKPIPLHNHKRDRDITL